MPRKIPLLPIAVRRILAQLGRDVQRARRRRRLTTSLVAERAQISRPTLLRVERRDQNRETASFEFDREWLADPVHHALGPALPPTAGAFHTSEGRALFGALGDSAPDRWGRGLIMRNEARRARAAGTTPRAPREI